MNHSILLVDDNRMYANWMLSLFASYNLQVKYVESSIEAIKELSQNPSRYLAIVSDITMEHPGAGLTMCWKMRRMGFQGIIWIVSTGFDYQSVFLLSRLTLKLFGVNGIIRKKELREHGIWEVHWLTKPIDTNDVLLKLTTRQSIPDWTKKS